MVKIPSLIVISFCLLVSVAFAQPAEESTAGTATLIVNITGFENSEGQVRVYLFNSKDGFPSKPAKARSPKGEARRLDA